MNGRGEKKCRLGRISTAGKEVSQNNLNVDF